MSSHNLHMTWSQEDDHPSVEQLRAYHAGQLPASACHQIESHLLSCELCSDMLEGMDQAAPVQTQQAVQELHHRIQKQLHKKKKKKWTVPGIGLDWKVAATLLLLICSIGLVLYSHFMQSKPDEEQIAYEPVLLEQPSTDTLDIMAPPRYKKREMAVASPKFIPPTIMGVGEAEVEAQGGPSLLVGIEESPAVAAADSINSAVVAEVGRISSKESTPLQQTLAARAEEVAVTPNSPTIRIRGSSSLTTHTVKGKVIDAQSGDPIPGVDVQLKGIPVTVATTDANGEFRVPVGEQNRTLVLNFIGYKPKELMLAQNASDVQVKLNSDEQALNEIVVTGYGTRKQKKEEAATNPAQPIAGENNYRQYLKQNLRYPSTAVAQKVKGKVVVGFTVDAQGQIKNMQVLKSLHPACDAEAIRLIKEGPAWKPGQINGQPTAEQVQITVRFKAPK